MKLVVFGLSVSSSWGNGHATLWRGLIRALTRRGHRVVFFERDVPYYAAHRDLGARDLPGAELRLYAEWSEALRLAGQHLDDCDAAMVTSFCPDGVPATDLVLGSRAPLRVFYDLDAPVTLARLRAGQPVSYLGRDGLRGFDLTLSYTGGAILDDLRLLLGARRVLPLYGSVDPDVHRPAQRAAQTSDLSYLGTWAEDRQAALERLFFGAARARPDRRFLLGGPMYPAATAWPANVWYREHVAPAEHPEFYGSSLLTLNVTRGAMARTGYCPSARLFEAAACGVPILTDDWPGLEQFFTPGQEVLVARDTRDVLEALSLPREVLARVARAARERTLAEHTADVRATELVDILGGDELRPGAEA